MSNKYVVYLDDDKDDLDIMQQLLEDSSTVQYQPSDNYTNFSDFLAEHSRSTCLIIVDINMPLINGIEVVKAIKGNDQLKWINTILFSTTQPSQATAAAEAMGVSFYSKPTNVSGYKKMFEELLHENHP